MTSLPPMYVFLGGLREDYCITHDGRTIDGVLGGNAIYAAVGARLWTDSVGLLSRAGINFPAEWLESIATAGIDSGGIKRLPETLDMRTFYAYISPDERTDTQPAIHYQRVGQALPKALKDYSTSTRGQDQRDEYAPAAVRPGDIPEHYLKALGIHLSPADYLSHSAISYRFQAQSSAIVTLDPSERYMTPSFRDELPRLLHGLDAFLPSEREVRAIFPSTGPDYWEFAETFASMGPRIVVIKLGAAGQLLYDRENDTRWRIPAYPASVRDVTGAGDAYCGGFLVGLERTGEPIEAALYGTISASLVIEGSGALFALQAAPGLAHARLEAWRGAVAQA